MKIFVFTLLFVLTFPASAFAQESATTRPAEVNAQYTVPVETMQVNSTTPRQVGNGQMKESVKDRVAKAREEAQEKGMTNRQAFQQKLGAMQDTTKKQVVTSIDQKITTFNTTHTQRLAEGIERMTAILDNIEKKSVEMKTAGVNTTTVETAITTARTALSNASTSVASQAAKVYVIQLGDESTVRSVVGATVSQFRADMRVTHQSVVNAKQAIANVTSAMAQLNNQDTVVETVESVQP